MGKTIQLKDNDYKTLLYPVTTAENVKFYDNQTLNEKLDGIIAGTKPVENTKYTTENGVKEFESKNGYIDNIHIEGKTLVNYAYKMEKLNLTEASGNISTTNGTVTESNGVYSYTTNGDWADIGQIISVHANTKYTFSVNLIELNNKKCNLAVMFFSEYPKINVSGANTSIRIDISKNSSITTTGRHYHTFTTPENCKYVLCVTSFEATGLTYKVSEIMLTEGDFVPYFEGIVSIGEGNKIELLTRNENIFDGIYETGAIDSKGVLITNKDRCRTSNYHLIEPNTSYYFSETINIYQYDNNKNFIENSHVALNSGGVFTSLLSARYIKFYNDNLQNLYVTKENKELLNTESKHDIKLIPTTLRSLFDGSKEMIFKKNGKYYKKILTGVHQCTGDDPVVNNIEVHGDYTRFALENQKQWGIVKLEERISLCDKFQTAPIFASTEFREGHYTSGGGRVYFKVLSSKLSSSTVGGVKEFLNNEKPVIVYELATPTIIEIPDFNLKAFKGQTSLLLNTGTLQGEVSFEVTNSSSSELEVIKDKLSSIDTQISGSLEALGKLGGIL